MGCYASDPQVSREWQSRCQVLYVMLLPGPYHPSPLERVWDRNNTAIRNLSHPILLSSYHPSRISVWENLDRGRKYRPNAVRFTRPRSRFSHTDRLNSVNKMFIIWRKQKQFNSFTWFVTTGILLPNCDEPNFILPKFARPLHSFFSSALWHLQK